VCDGTNAAGVKRGKRGERLKAKEAGNIFSKSRRIGGGRVFI